jgi:hypothetical protein
LTIKPDRAALNGDFVAVRIMEAATKSLLGAALQVQVEVAEHAEVGTALQGLGLDVKDDVQNRLVGIRPSAWAEAATEIVL